MMLDGAAEIVRQVDPETADPASWRSIERSRSNSIEKSHVEDGWLGARAARDDPSMCCSVFDQASNPLQPGVATVERILLPQLAIEQLERKRTAIADRAQVAITRGRSAMPSPTMTRSSSFWVSGFGTGRHVVDVEAGETIARRA